MKDDRVKLLRNRLLATGDLAGTASMLSAIFDDDLEKAVMHLQQRYGLEPDGIVGNNTLAAMNVPVEMRIDQIRLDNPNDNFSKGHSACCEKRPGRPFRNAISVSLTAMAKSSIQNLSTGQNTPEKIFHISFGKIPGRIMHSGR
jgi:hypothetical protein